MIKIISSTKNKLAIKQEKDKEMVFFDCFTFLNCLSIFVGIVFNFPALGIGVLLLPASIVWLLISLLHLPTATYTFNRKDNLFTVKPDFLCPCPSEYPLQEIVEANLSTKEIRWGAYGYVNNFPTVILTRRRTRDGKLCQIDLCLKDSQQEMQRVVNLINNF
jgi:hypothetical protein